MQLLRRLIAWLCFAGFLTAVGVVVFHWVRYTPRFVVEGKEELFHISDEGRWLVTGHLYVDPDTGKETALLGHFQIYDTRSGHKVRSLSVYPPDRDGSESGLAKSPNGALFAWTLGGQCHILEWRTGSEWNVPIEKSQLGTTCEFSAHGRWLIVRLDYDSGAHTIIIDVATRQIARRMDRQVIGFVDNEQLAIVWTEMQRIDLMNVQTGALNGTIKTGVEGEWGLVSPWTSSDGRLICFSYPLDKASGETSYNVEIWDVQNRRKIFKYAGKDWRRGDEPDWMRVIFSNQGKYYATWQPRPDWYELLIFTIGEPKPRATHKVMRDKEEEKRRGGQITYLHACTFSADDAYCLFTVLDNGTARTSLFETSKARHVWEGTGFVSEWLGTFESGIVCTHDAKGGVYLLDPQDSQIRHAIATDVVPKHYGSRLSSDGRLVILQGERDKDGKPVFLNRLLDTLRPKWLNKSETIVVIEPQSGRELFRETGGSDFADVTGDGNTLVTWSNVQYPAPPVQSVWGVQLWSIHPHRAYFWAVAWSLGVGGGLLLGRRWWRKRKARVKTQTAG